jgi:hypothetical protein
MSRLDSFIRRLESQRVLLNEACAALNADPGFDGPVIELGLGNGRTYSHLQERLAGRRILVFERQPNPNAKSLPPAEDLLVGEIQEVAADFAQRFGAKAVLVHADLGDGSAAYDAQLQSWLPDLCRALLRSGGRVLSSTELSSPHLQVQPLPAGVMPGKYYCYNRM